MFRKKAPADGMLFVFSQATSGGFWMKNTLVPLTIVYFDTAGRRVRRMSMTPCRKDPCRIYDPGRQYRYALELPAPIRGLRDASALRPSSNVSSAQRAKRVPVRLAILLVALLLVPAAAAQQRPVVVIDPGHDLRANAQTEPIGPGSSTRKIKDGGGTRGVVSGLREADLNLRVSLRLRTLLERAGVRVVMTRTADGRHQHREHRAREDREPRRRRSVPPSPCGRFDRPDRPRNAHALPGPTRRLDGRHLLREQARRPDRPGRSPCGARLP